MATQHPSNKPRKKGPKLTKDGKITVFDVEDTSYGIRELIDLIRYIPDGQDVFFGAEMIKKTLSSMQLSIHDIMQDGVEKRKLAAKTIQHLVAEISDYQRRIQSLKGHIRHLRFELGEIQDTCHYLLSDDIELSQYQHILDEVPKSPIEGGETDDDADLELDRAKSKPSLQTPPIVEPMAEPDKSSTPPIDESAKHAQDFEPSETLVEPSSLEDDEFVPDAFKNPDEDYKEASDSAVLTDEVFDPDRFDDENGVQSGASPNAPEYIELTADDEPDNDDTVPKIIPGTQKSPDSLTEDTDSDDDFTELDPEVKDDDDNDLARRL